MLAAGGYYYMRICSGIFHHSLYRIDSIRYLIINEHNEMTGIIGVLINAAALVLSICSFKQGSTTRGQTREEGMELARQQQISSFSSTCFFYTTKCQWLLAQQPVQEITPSPLLTKKNNKNGLFNNLST